MQKFPRVVLWILKLVLIPFFAAPLFADGTSDKVGSLEVVMTKGAPSGRSTGGTWEVMGVVQGPESTGPSTGPKSRFEVHGGLTSIAQKERQVLFADGFECGDTSEWDFTFGTLADIKEESMQ